MADSVKVQKMTLQEIEQYAEDFQKNMKQKFEEIKARKNNVNGSDRCKRTNDNVECNGIALANAEDSNTETLSIVIGKIALAAANAENPENEGTNAVALSILKCKCEDEDNCCFIVKRVPCCRKR
ncbi:hypothetical protein GOM49_11960 [Clostridium bovifaecis]|uniref:Uncharacterized protein n=1 Tax=Clostridium bovifaecis TaxID=2184719 RepID=A0A6I6ETS0_9CLOT|nr:hypothetical protein GOM49_11960 [Clostridium bovifaecis]